ncbi:MAG: IS21 family transposase [Coriobacteriaceae bacterium]|nr:IS21 family transposase [Coriobacteriaceae bacterium]
MTVSQDTRNEIRAMDADGVPRAEIARRLGLSRNTVAKYADMEDMSPAAPVPAPRERPALEGNGAWVESVLEADAGAPRKQRHTARRIYDRLVEERGFAGSYSTVRRFVRDWRLSRAPGPGEGYLELEWRPGTCQVDYGNFRATVAGEPLELKLLVATLPHSNDRQCVATRSQRSECMCAGLAEIFGRWGRAPRLVVLDNATEAGRMVRGEVTESALFSQFKGHYRFESRYCNPYSGNEKGSVENAVGFLRRNLLVPVPSFGSMAELNRSLAEGCARLNASARCRDGRPSGEALREDLSEMRALPGVAFDAVRWVPVRADKRGYVEVDGREYVAGPAWHDRRLLAGVRADTVEILADRGRRVAVLPRAFGEGPAVRNPLSLVPALVARPRAFGESTIRRDMPAALVEGIDRMDAAGRRRALRSISRASEASGFEAACRAALRVVEGGRVPDDATVDVLARRIAAGGGDAAGGPDLGVYDGFLKGAAADGR